MFEKGSDSMPLFRRKPKIDKNEWYLEYIIQQKKAQIGVKYRAISKAIDLIATAASSCIIENYAYKDNKIQEIQDIIYYKLNVRPNDNEIAQSFWYNFWSKLLWEQEVLVISLNHKMYLAEDFKYDNAILKNKTYYDIILKSDNDQELKLNRSFNSSEVIYLNLKDSKAKKFLDEFYKEFGVLLEVANIFYKHSNTPKYLFEYPGIQQPIKDAKTGEEITYEEYKSRITKGLLSEEPSVIMLSKNFSLDKMESGRTVSSEDYLKLKTSWEESVADSFLIPRNIYFGNNLDKNVDESYFLSYAVKPYLIMLEAALNSSIKTKVEYIKGERFKINMNSIKVYNLLDNATAFDKLYSDGFSHNDIRKVANLMPLDEEWANEHRITKNYSEDVSAESKGGG